MPQKCISKVEKFELDSLKHFKMMEEKMRRREYFPPYRLLGFGFFDMFRFGGRGLGPLYFSC